MLVCLIEHPGGGAAKLANDLQISMPDWTIERFDADPAQPPYPTLVDPDVAIVAGQIAVETDACWCFGYDIAVQSLYA